ncbi:MAG: ABC transporter substrate-binding protein [Deltaproteobacteria bacterium]|nr:MAG: ABC transporter substrate-binding protein [Deltaproteobacteria bacterium]
MRSMLCTALLFALGATPALAGAPQERVRQTVDGVSAVVKDPQLQASSKEHDRRERVAKVMHESFDFRTMARESLGPHWASLTPEQQDRFVGLFTQLFERSYDRLVLRFLGGSTTTYGAESVDAERAVVTTALLRKGGDELPIDYRLTADGGVWKISDVVVDGVSLAGNFRAQFVKTIRASSYDALVQRIEAKLAAEK